jgi:hypothetical protein
LLGAGLALLGAQLVYLLAANTILWTRSLDGWVTGASKDLSLEVESGWTLWPGRVHVRGVELHFADHNVQFSVALESAVVDLALWQLPTKTFHLTRVRAQGVRYLFRHRVKDPVGIERRLALYPKIAGYADPPLFVGPALPPLSDADYNLWTIQLDDVDVAVRELWFLEFRFTGQGRARGAFRLQPQRDARTDACSLDLNGALQAGTQTVASKLTGRIEAQLDRHDPRLVKGAAIFKKLSFDIRLGADLPDLSFTSLYAGADGLTLRRGAGRVSVRAHASHGAWRDDSSLDYVTKDIAIAQPAAASVAGALSLRAKIVKPGIDSRLQLTAASRQLVLGFPGTAQRIERPRAREVRIVLTTTADMSKPIRVTALSARLRLAAPELRWLNGPLDSEGLFGNGSATANAQVHWSEGKLARVQLAMNAKEAGFALAGRAVQISGTLDSQLSYDPRTYRGSVQQLTVEMPLLVVAANGVWKALPGGLHVRTERFVWRGLPPGSFRSRFALDTDSIKPLVPLLISSSLLRGLALTVFHLGQTHAVIEVDQSVAALELRLAHAQSGSVRASGVLKKQNNGHDACGWFFINSASLNVGLVLQAGATSVKPFVPNDWWRKRPTTLACERTPS